MDQCIRVLIVDDHSCARRGLRALLATRPVVQVICEAENGREALRLIEESQPDVVLMDIQMPECDGLEATRRIKAQWPQVKVIALTANAVHQAAAVSAGADAFLLKGCPTKDLLAAIHDDGVAQQDAATPKGKVRDDSSAVGGTERRPARLAAAALLG